MITDKPYPYDFIEEALVTITKVKVRRFGGVSCDGDCDDELFCNGIEACVDGACQAGTAPCEDFQSCDEGSNACLNTCSMDSDCDDGAHCNGVETCIVDTGLCAAGTSPCGPESYCNEGTDACDDACSNDDQCDDGLYCNGAEFCEDGACEDGEEPECEDGAVCDESANACTGGDEDGGYPFVVIFEGEQTFDLLDLQNGRSDLLAEAEDLPAGQYNLMRVYVTRGKVTLKDGAGEFDLFVPSGAQTGIKLFFDFEIDAGEETQLILDVDLSRAFRAIPGGRIDDPSTIQNFIFTPAVAMRLINVLDAGGISGTVTDDAAMPMAGAAVTAYDEEGNEVTSTSTESDGTYVLGGLLTGEYRVEFSLTGYADLSVEGVSVMASEATENVNAALVASP